MEAANKRLEEVETLKNQYYFELQSKKSENEKLEQYRQEYFNYDKMQEIMKEASIHKEQAIKES